MNSADIFSVCLAAYSQKGETAPRQRDDRLPHTQQQHGHQGFVRFLFSGMQPVSGKEGGFYATSAFEPQVFL
ncbi:MULTISPECIES: hypothetical protein [unclassified Undibacterium]|uniref:hypothetical protein n=1 Tax=unclassified Undibacterium TaxID=2630295 RepID=UPI003C2F2E35